MSTEYGIADFRSEGSYDYKDLFAGHGSVVDEKVTLSAGKAYVKGQVLEPNGTEWQAVTGDAPARARILSRDVDATAGVMEAIAYVKGRFIRTALIGIADAAVTDALVDHLTDGAAIYPE